MAVFYVFQSHSNYKQIESIQRCFTRRLFIRIHNNQNIPDYCSRLKLFGLDTLSIRYVRLYLVTLYKIIHKQIHVEEFHVNFSRRHCNRIIVPGINSAHFRSSFFHKAYVLWNAIIKNREFDSFSLFLDFISTITSDSLPP